MKHKKHILIGLILVVAAVSFSFQSRFFEIAKQIEIYNTLFKELNLHYVNEINPGELTNKVIKSTLKNLDPYTVFLNEQDVEDFKIRREGEYGGIGITTYYDKKGITIAEVYKGFPADKVGLKVGDVITSVNGQQLIGTDKEQLTMILKGVPGKALSLQVNRHGKLMRFDVTLDKVILNPVPFFEMIDEETGYIVLSRFTAYKATDEVKKAFNSLKEKGMKKLVFDLRSNPGGSLYDAVNIVNLFIPKGNIVVETKGKLKKESRTYTGKQDPLDIEIPIVVLINGRSASASEIVSGALQDYDRAVIMGNRSYGKGLVQRYFELSYGTQLKATISKYYTPSGRCIQELDYANRDPKTGKVPKFSEGKVNTFKTKNGRTVYDGGGVTPDVTIKTSAPTEVTKKLVKSRAIFNFVTQYIQNKNSSLEDYTFSKNDFDAFTTYLKTTDTSFVTQPESLFKKAYQSVDNKTHVTSNYNNILTQLKNSKVVEISKNKDILIQKIQDEILKHLFYKKGVYEYHLKNDTTIQDAVRLLKNQKKYQKILAGN